MSIPDFNTHGVLPPFNGELRAFDGATRNRRATSPYPATTLELCQRFGTSRDRRAILTGFLDLRALLHQLQIVEGFQWVDGAFLEKDGKRNGKPLGHIQVVTFYHPSPLYHDPAYADQFDPLKSAKMTRAQFCVDHGLVNLDWTPMEIIDWTRHWAALLSHQAETGIWKGMLEISLHTLQEDAAARQYLQTLEKP